MKVFLVKYHGFIDKNPDVLFLRDYFFELLKRYDKDLLSYKGILQKIINNVESGNLKMNFFERILNNLSHYSGHSIFYWNECIREFDSRKKFSFFKENKFKIDKRAVSIIKQSSNDFILISENYLTEKLINSKLEFASLDKSYFNYIFHSKNSYINFNNNSIISFISKKWDIEKENLILLENTDIIDSCLKNDYFKKRIC
ncbi:MULTISPECIES: hypothetical protein [Oceanotoga]|uniref:Uncharacterized protein n=1 Tax=Oceanotoga teriensis TaxID=515440 RepID=A0AA45C4R6_9BACT|nr:MULTISPECIES: hypothetical protein [Oceanotoga]MDN5343164.1 hypothetical protein [Oceanotoga sp.]MDO7977754.1 hypothetical protein [Oceanotoga teriensis]PWJ87131.1 hypothetical protein C7380_12613 [Oceanotoga teriensis]